MNDQVKSAARVLELLEMMAIAPAPLGISEVARRLEIPKSSAQALLGTLLARGYLERNGVDYRLPESLGGGWVGGLPGRLLRLAQPLMRQAADRSGESAFLGTLASPLRIQYVAKEISRNEVRYDASLDHLRLMHATSIGLLFLAHLEDGGLDRFLKHPLERVTPGTVVDPEELRKLLRQVQERGYAEVRDANVSGASGVSAPIFAPDGQVIAGLNLGAPSFRYDRARAAMVSEVIAAATDLTQQLRGRMVAAA